MLGQQTTLPATGGAELTVPPIVNTDVGKSILASGTDSRSGSRAFDALSFAVVSFVGVSLVCTLVLREPFVRDFFSSTYLAWAISLCLLAGTIQATAGLPVWLVKLGSWRKTHCIEAILRPLAEPSLDGRPWELVAKNYEIFVQEVFEPFVNGHEHGVNPESIRQFHKAFTWLKFARISVFLSFLSEIALLIAWVSHVAQSTDSVLAGMIVAVAIGCLSYFWIERSEQRRIAVCTQEEVFDIRYHYHTALRHRLRYAWQRVDRAFSDHGRVVSDAGSNTLARQIDTPGNLEHIIAERLLLAQERVVIWDPQSLPRNWVFHLLPGIVYCRQRTLRVDVIISGEAPSDISASFQFLQALGCNVTVNHSPGPDNPTNFSGVVVDPGGATANLLVSLASGTASILGWEMSGPHLQPLLTTLAAQIESPSVPLANASAAQLSRMDESRLINRLRRVPQYEHCEMKMASVDVRHTMPMARQIKWSSLAQVQEWIQLYRDASLELFEPAKLSLLNGLYSPVLPPVLEKDQNGMFRVHEGHTRLHYLLNDPNLKADSPVMTRAMVVDGTLRPPEGKGPWSWEDVDPVFDADYDRTYKHSHSMELLTRGSRDSNRVFHWELMTSTELGLDS
jgi:hypothetical protein